MDFVALHRSSVFRWISSATENRCSDLCNISVAPLVMVLVQLGHTAEYKVDWHWEAMHDLGAWPGWIVTWAHGNGRRYMTKGTMQDEDQ